MEKMEDAMDGPSFIGKTSEEITRQVDAFLKDKRSTLPGSMDFPKNTREILESPEYKPQIYDCARFAIEEHNKSVKQFDIKYDFEKVLSVKTSHGGGRIFRMTIEARELLDKEEGVGQKRGSLKIIEATVSFRIYSNTKTLMDFKENPEGASKLAAPGIAEEKTASLI